jgi:hypothetical protein
VSERQSASAYFIITVVMMIFGGLAPFFISQKVIIQDNAMTQKHTLNTLLSDAIICAYTGKISSMAIVSISTIDVISVRALGDLPSQRKHLEKGVFSLVLSAHGLPSDTDYKAYVKIAEVKAFNDKIVEYLTSELIRVDIGELTTIGLVWITPNHSINASLVGDKESHNYALLEGLNHLFYEIESVASCYRQVLEGFNHHFKPVRFV